MTPPKPSPPKPPGTTKPGERKPWKKKTPVELVLEQTDKLKAQIAEKEEEIKDLQSQLQKFEQARKIFEA
jgi:septal ring factor EnvC (AmiA/AmiB activator)